MLGEVRFEGLSVGTDDEVDEAARQVERDVEGGRTETHGGEWGERRGAGQTMHADDEQEHEDVVDEQAHDAPLDDPVACGGAHTAAVTHMGVVYTWGRGKNGRLVCILFATTT